MTRDPFPMWARHLLWLALGFGINFAVLHWLWPWLGPKCFQPCPLASSTGCYVLAGWFGLRHWFRRFNEHITEERFRMLRSSLYR